jgi:hypothetical protein
LLTYSFVPKKISSSFVFDLDKNDDRCVIEHGTVYFRQMVFHRSADGGLLRARIRGLPSPKFTPPHWVPQREDEAQLHRVAGEWFFYLPLHFTRIMLTI